MLEKEVELLHETTLKILEEVGIRLEHDTVVERVLKAGAVAGPEARVVRFPRSMVSEYLGVAPSTVELANRSGHSDELTSTSSPLFWTNPGLHILDGHSFRDITASDLGSIARLCDCLPNVEGVMGMAMADVAPRHRDFVGVRVIAQNCRKHVRALCFTPTGMEALAEMKNVFPGPWLSIGFTAHGPLRWTHLALDIFLKSSGHGIPTTINGEPMAGVSGPVTIAGSSAVGNAEILSGILVNQVLEPGRPVIYNLGLAHTFDMRHATAVTGGPENALFAEVSAAMGRFYELPSSSWVSTDSLFDDSQAALEKMFGLHSHMEAGVNLIWGLGQLESEKTISPVQLVIDNEMIDYVQHHRKSFQVTPQTLQYDLIRQVGIAGSFLETEHTLVQHHEHLWRPRLLNRRSRHPDRMELEALAREQAQQILSGPQENAIGEDELKELRRIEETYRAIIG